MPFWCVVMGVVNIIMGVARGRYHQLPVGVAMVPEGSLKKLEPMEKCTRYYNGPRWGLWSGLRTAASIRGLL